MPMGEEPQLPSPSEGELRHQAERRVKRKVELLSYPGTFLVINGSLAVA